MDRSTLSLKRVALVLGLAALNGLQVGAAAVDTRELRCHRGYGGRCPRGFDCVKAPYGPHSTCTRKYGGYYPSTTTPYTTTSTSSYQSTLCTSPPAYTTSGPEYTSPGYPTADSTSPEYPPAGYTPPGYQPSGYEPSGYQPSGYQPSGYQPSEYQPSGYQPSEYQPSGYHPTDYQSSEYQPSGYQPTGYQPSGYEPSGYQPSSYQPTGYQPSEYQPSGYQPTGYQSSGYQPSGYTQNCQHTSFPHPHGYGPLGYNSTTCGNGNSDGGDSSGGGSGNGSGNGTSGGDTEPGFTPVVGVGVKTVVERRPIDVLQNEHPDVFNMFVLALESLQKRNESISVSWYQVSGIHGYPYVPWQEPDLSPPFPQLGYCIHGSVLFTTWHRPYLVLLEQLLYEEAVKTAKDFTGEDAAKYQAAAEEVRLPYWDWALNEASSRIPTVLQQTSITVVKPGSGSIQIPNPLYNYRFLNPQPQSLFEATTIRGADANDVLAASFPSRRESTLSFFALDDYNQFSTELENVHNGVHVNVGGDMSQVPTAAFDPIFWLHHTQVDRIMAMYQATHPGVYLTPESRSESESFSLQGSGNDDLSTPLGPFRHADRTFWNSDEVKTAESIFKYGYSYPEVPQGKSTDELRVFTTEKVNQLYGVNTNDPSFVGDVSGAPETPTARREWSANVLVDSEELPGSHRILIYVGPYDESRPDTNNLAGVAAIFTGPERMPEANRQLNITVPLTSALVEKNVALRPEDAIPALAGELHWAVERVGKSVETVPVASLRTLQVSVVSHIVTYPQNDTALPVKSEPLTHYAPTVGKVGGLQPGEVPSVGNVAPPSLDSGLTNSTTSSTSSTSSSLI